MTTTVEPSSQPATCSGDQGCRTLNARCYPGVSPDAVPQSQIPVNNSLHCYCNLMYHWIGPECSQLSWQSIVMGLSSLFIATISFGLAVAVIVDMVKLKRYLSRHAQKSGTNVRRPLIHSPRSTQVRSQSNSKVSRRLNCCCLDPETKNGMDMHIVTSILLFIALTTWAAFMLIDTIQIWALQLCSGADGARHSCLMVTYGVFRCLAPIFLVSLLLLLSVLMYNASFRANGLSSLPCASFWTLLVLNIVLVVTLVVASALDNLIITSVSGTFFALLVFVLNAMACYRLRDFSFFRLVLQWCSCGRLGVWQEDRPQWTIKQRLMMINLAICFFTMMILICLIIRAVFLSEHLVDPTIIVDYIFRWSYLGILIVYFSLIHYNSKQRVRVLIRRITPPSISPLDVTKEERSFQSSQPSVSKM